MHLEVVGEKHLGGSFTHLKNMRKLIRVWTVEWAELIESQKVDAIGGLYEFVLIAPRELTAMEPCGVIKSPLLETGV
jgi:hypothetical protein